MVGIELRIGLAPRRKQFVAGDDVVAILVVAVEALLLARLLARLGRLARERRWRCDRFQRRRGRKQGRRRAAADQEPSRQIGRESGRDRVCQSVEIPVVAENVKKTKKTTN